jgi:two-component system cell cycle sensor histidine kinase/response regulator CckA
MRREIIFPLSHRSAATRLAIAFVLWSAMWVVTSDYFLYFVFGSPLNFWGLQTEKGLIYVAVSGALLWFSIRSMERDEAGRRASNESKLRSLKESGLIGVSGWASDGKITYANETLAQILGYSQHELLGADASKFIPVECAEIYRRAEKELLERGRTSIHELQLMRKDGSRVPVLGGRALVEGTDHSCIGYFLDTSGLKRSEAERKRLEEELVHSEKINALGQLAGGIAHDFNNQLAVIIGYTSLLESKLGSDESSRENTQQVLRAADRARTLIRQLLAFSRKQMLRREVVDLNKLLREMQSMLRPLVNENIEIVLKLSPEPQLVEIDQSQFEQVLLNLVVNGRDAMPQGGVLTLTLSHSRVESESKESMIGSGEYVTLQVSDTGCGIEDSIKQRIFEPFFTTKQHKGGTGLGLSTAYGIVTQSGGEISVTSKTGIGSSFTIQLPRLQKARDAPAQATPEDGRDALAATVLLVEDLEDLREITAQILSDRGLRVLQAKDGLEAVEMARKHNVIDLVLSDIVMPRLNGPEAVRRIRESHPNIKVIYLSGYADSVITEEDDVLLAKPITPDALIASIRNSLDKNVRSTGADQSHSRRSAA